MIDLNNNGTDDFQEIANGIKEFLNEEATLITNDVDKAAAWLKGEVAGLPDAAKQFFSAVVAQVQTNGVGSLGEQVADALTMLYNDALHAAVGLPQEAVDAVKAISSSVVTAAVGLITPSPTA